jgi:hypothetical protein
MPPLPRPPLWPPVNAEGVTVEFDLVVDDGLASSEPAHVTVQVRNINDPPSCEDPYAEPKRLWPRTISWCR